MPTSTKPGGTDIVDRSGNGNGCDIDSDLFLDLPFIAEVPAVGVPLPIAGFQVFFIDIADSKLKRKDHTGTVTIIG